MYPDTTTFHCVSALIDKKAVIRISSYTPRWQQKYEVARPFRIVSLDCSFDISLPRAHAHKHFRRQVARFKKNSCNPWKSGQVSLLLSAYVCSHARESLIRAEKGFYILACFISAYCPAMLDLNVHFQSASKCYSVCSDATTARPPSNDYFTSAYSYLVAFVKVSHSCFKATCVCFKYIPSRVHFEKVIFELECLLATAVSHRKPANSRYGFLQSMKPYFFTISETLLMLYIRTEGNYHNFT